MSNNHLNGNANNPLPNKHSHADDYVKGEKMDKTDKTVVIYHLTMGIIKDLHTKQFLTQQQMEQAIKKLTYQNEGELVICQESK